MVDSGVEWELTGKCLKWIVVALVKNTLGDELALDRGSPLAHPLSNALISQSTEPGEMHRIGLRNSTGIKLAQERREKASE